jgi:hypothetical protein
MQLNTEMQLKTQNAAENANATENCKCDRKLQMQLKTANATWTAIEFDLEYGCNCIIKYPAIVLTLLPMTPDNIILRIDVPLVMLAHAAYIPRGLPLYSVCDVGCRVTMC